MVFIQIQAGFDRELVFLVVQPGANQLTFNKQSILRMDTTNTNLKEKNVFQVAHYIKNSIYKDSLNYDAIIAYCQKNFSQKIKASKPSFDPDSSEAIGIDEFGKWRKEGFGAGDFVWFEDYIGIVWHNSPHFVTVCVKIKDGKCELVKESVPVEDVIRANEIEELEARKTMISSGYDFNLKGNCIIEKFVPAGGSYVEFSNYSQNFHGIGVLCCINDFKEVVMYCYLTFGENEELQYGREQIIGKLEEFSFSPFRSSEYQRRKLEGAFNRIGKTWNHAQKRAEPIGYEMEKGDTYFFIDDRMSVKPHPEDKTFTSHKRYLSGNYFRTSEEAYAFLAEIKKLRREFFAALPGNMQEADKSTF